MKKVFNFIVTAVETIITVVLLVLVVLLAIQRFSNNGSFFGYRIYTVASDSMIPIYTIGDTLLIEDTEVDKIEIGDALTYQGESGSMKGKIITHQVVDIEIVDGQYQFHTKGTANDIEDPIVYEDQVFGKVVHKFGVLSILGKITTNMSSLLMFITFPIAILIAIEIIKVYKSKDDEDDEEEEESVNDAKNDENVEESFDEENVNESEEEDLEDEEVNQDK
ncbi:MAG: signal peptidase I [Bacilli bacterium]|nr:signal peptidase I [Bacilli bacterium]